MKYIFVMYYEKYLHIGSKIYNPVTFEKKNRNRRLYEKEKGVIHENDSFLLSY